MNLLKCTGDFQGPRRYLLVSFPESTVNPDLIEFPNVILRHSNQQVAAHNYK